MSLIKGVCGIIGGSGPLASLKLHQNILQEAVDRGAHQDDDYPPLVISSRALKGFDSKGSMDARTDLELLEVALSLEAAGASYLVAACNTIHLKLEKLNLPLPFLSMIDLSVKEVEKQKVTLVGVLSSSTSSRHQLYENKLHSKNITTLNLPNRQADIDLIISEAMRGNHLTTLLESLVEELQAQGVDKIILGCTELSLIKTDNKHVIDPLNILARKIVNLNESKQPVNREPAWIPRQHAQKIAPRTAISGR